MKESYKFPPLYSQIKEVLHPPDDAIFCFGDIIYNPSKGKIPEDILIHEQRHSIQQRDYTDPELWWYKFLNDSNFRLAEEIEAYATQYQFIKQHYPNKALKEALSEMAKNLSSLYNCGISESKAATLIRKYN